MDATERAERLMKGAGKVLAFPEKLSMPVKTMAEDSFEVAKAFLNDEVKFAQLRAIHDRYEKALIRLRDCDWTRGIGDRMDAVRDIAREALVVDNMGRESEQERGL